MRILKSFAFPAMVILLCVLPKLTAEEKLDLPGRSVVVRQAEELAVRQYPWERADTATIRAKLATRAGEIRFDGIAFEQLVEYFRDLVSVNVVVNWSALETAAIEKDKEVRLAVKDLRYDEVLDSILEDVGGGEVELGYDIRNNSICISTKEDLCRRTFVHIYNVGDLLDAAVRRIDNASRNDQIGQLITIIQENVDPESWRQVGGNVGAIREFADLLVVAQTQTAHEQIWDLLADLRTALARDR